ncbi:MAG: hypothetical protein R6U61_09290 [Thermoplasmata archaeon]
MIEEMKQSTFMDFEDKEIVIDPYADKMSEAERIDFIREHGTESMQRGLNSVFQSNKYKPIKGHMWKGRLHKGKKMVRTIIEKKPHLVEND